MCTAQTGQNEPNNADAALAMTTAVGVILTRGAVRTSSGELPLRMLVGSSLIRGVRIGKQHWKCACVRMLSLLLPTLGWYLQS